MFTYNATVYNVVDADTADLDIDLGFGIFKKTRVRLARVDAPEIHTEEGKRAKEYVDNLLTGRGVVVRTQKTGKFGRWIAEIHVPTKEGMKNLSDLLIEHGLAQEVDYS